MLGKIVKIFVHEWVEEGFQSYSLCPPEIAQTFANTAPIDVLETLIFEELLDDELILIGEVTVHEGYTDRINGLFLEYRCNSL